MDVTVWFLAERHATRRWSTDVSGSFRWEILSGWSFDVEIQRQEKGTLHFNPSLVWRIPRGRFDVVVLRGWSSPSYLLAQLVCMWFKIPTILWSGSVPGALAYGGKSQEKPVGRRGLFRPLLQWWVGNTHAYIAYGTRSRKYLIELGADPNRIYCVWNTVDVDKVMVAADVERPKRDNLRTTLGVRPTDILLLYVGLLQPLKYVDTLIQAYDLVSKQRSDVVLGLVGYGECESALRLQANQIGSGRIAFFGHVALDDLSRYYTAADIFVLPSVDIWGLVVNEAMSCGLPIVASEAVGCTDDLVISGVNGLTFPHGDVEALTRALLLLADDSAMRERMGRASCTHIQNYTYIQAVPALARALRNDSGKGKYVPAVESKVDFSEIRVRS
ncbi:MAG: glycosyltransferase [Nitrospirae bacterium]|nr:glycosyltransferase [Nitrospirota bacterium]